MPLLIMTLVLLVITILLAIADKLLVSYGECKISVEKEGEKKEFTVQGGCTLLSALLENGIQVPASCAGRGSCGYCKVNVRSGGGQMLPTEELFISKDEEKIGTRLACQVKVKEDVELYVPDLITTVKGMAKNNMFDTSLKWQFIRKDVEAVVPERAVKPTREMANEVDAIVERHKGIPGSLMPAMQDVNETFKYLPEPVLRMLSVGLDEPLSKIFRIATEDKTFTLDAVRCIGCCGLAPVLTVNEDVHGLMTKSKISELIDQYRSKKD
jgi:NADH:ubiquinone oxidoreductase subunit E/ferredoxin